MKDFLSTRLPAQGRLLYAAYLGFTLLGFATALALYWDGIGLDRAAEHYLGNADDPDATEILVEKSARELLEVAHFHLFTMPVVLLVSSHLFLLSGAGAWRRVVVGVAVISTLLHLAAPWVVRFGGPGAAWVMPATALPFAGSYLVMILAPLPTLLRPP